MVTGASRGIGKGIALELGAAGATVYVTGRSTTPGRLPGTVNDTATEIDALGGTGIPYICDHRDDDAVQRLFEMVRGEQGRLDLLVNNVYNSPAAARWLGKPFWEVPPTAWDETFDVGVRSHYAASVYAAPLLRESGGLIVNISSPAPNGICTMPSTASPKPPWIGSPPIWRTNWPRTVSRSSRCGPAL